MKEKYYHAWDQVMRFNGQRTYIAYRCPHCRGSGDSPYYDKDLNRIRCECCQGQGYKI